MRFRLVSMFVASTAVAFPLTASAIAPTVQLNYTGGEQSYVVPSGVVLLGIAAVGGRGGGYGGPTGGTAGDLGRCCR